MEGMRHPAKLQACRIRGDSSPVLGRLRRLHQWLGVGAGKFPFFLSKNAYSPGSQNCLGHSSLTQTTWASAFPGSAKHCHLGSCKILGDPRWRPQNLVKFGSWQNLAISMIMVSGRLRRRGTRNALRHPWESAHGVVMHTCGVPGLKAQNHWGGRRLLLPVAFAPREQSNWRN